MKPCKCWFFLWPRWYNVDTIDYRPSENHQPFPEPILLQIPWEFFYRLGNLPILILKFVVSESSRTSSVLRIGSYALSCICTGPRYFQCFYTRRITLNPNSNMKQIVSMRLKDWPATNSACCNGVSFIFLPFPSHSYHAIALRRYKTLKVFNSKVYTNFDASGSWFSFHLPAFLCRPVKLKYFRFGVESMARDARPRSWPSKMPQQMK